MGERARAGPAPSQTRCLGRSNTGPIAGCTVSTLTRRTSNTSAALCPTSPAGFTAEHKRESLNRAAPSWEGLSSFQESVAMDRIQRIMGVLQNPCMGEKYMNIILKMEEMLKSWFPNVKLQDQLAATQTEEPVPTKKPKLSSLNTPAAVSPVTISDPPAGVKPLRVTDLTPPGAYSASNLKWFHTSPICSPTAEQAQAGPRHLLAPRDRDLTQDNAVSSSTDSLTKTDSVPRGPPPGKINAPCLERLLKSTESIITPKGTGGVMDSSWS
uniref:Circadian-associated transcriptional repressor-like n=1 Tax=Sparus aurata TaxID=8175 RepID=A0A671UN48_SPAAU